jgi:glyoxylase-like metal-dependent hydrolase (beta-lactamase superfamily II)
MIIQNKYLLPVLLLATLAACSPSDETTADNKNATPSKQVPDFPFAFEQISENGWVMHGPRELPNPENKGFMNNPGIIKTSAGLVIVDPGSTVQVGKNVLSKIKLISNQNIVAVFNTHVHGDHWLANQAIKAAYPDVKIYGHQNMLEEIADGAGDNWVELMDSMTEGASQGTKVVGPDNAVNSDDIIKIGNTQFKIHHYGVAHTNTDIMIEVIEESIVFLGDNVLAKRIPRMTDGTFQGSISSINSVLESNAKIYVPGHGPTGNSEMVKNYLNYVVLIYEAAQKTFEEDLDSSDVIAITKQTTAAYKDWFGYDDLLGPQGAQAYSEVEEAEF